LSKPGGIGAKGNVAVQKSADRRLRLRPRLQSFLVGNDTSEHDATALTTILNSHLVPSLLLTVSTSALIPRPTEEVGDKGEGRNPVRNQPGQPPVWRELNRLKLRKH
jgi:hypothetical protein